MIAATIIPCLTFTNMCHKSMPCFFQSLFSMSTAHWTSVIPTHTYWCQALLQLYIVHKHTSHFQRSTWETCVWSFESLIPCGTWIGLQLGIFAAGPLPSCVKFCHTYAASHQQEENRRRKWNLNASSSDHCFNWEISFNWDYAVECFV